MTSDEFEAILDAAGLDRKRARELLGVGASTLSRWLNGETPISQDKAKLIRERIKPKGK